MRRLLTVFLCLILTAQFAWAAAANYCVHEAGKPVLVHFGHHDDEHALAERDAKAGLKAQGFNADVDHGHCHLPVVLVARDAAPHAMTQAQAAPLRPSPGDRESHVPEGPERPNWARA